MKRLECVSLVAWTLQTFFAPRLTLIAAGRQNRTTWANRGSVRNVCLTEESRFACYSVVIAVLIGIRRFTTRFNLISV
jgi:hypothetical protein